MKHIMCWMLSALFFTVGCSGGGGGQNGDNPPTCQAPFVPSGNACVCPNGQHQEGNTCAYDVACADGRVWNGSACVCPTGQTWNGSACVCPEGYDKVGQSCLIHCDLPFVRNSNGTSCVCPEGYHQAGNTCETCPSGQTWNGSACVDVSCGNDTTPPIMEYFDPYNQRMTGLPYYKGRMTFHAGARDNLGGSGIDRFEFLINDRPACDASNPFLNVDGWYYSSCYFDTTTVSDGNYTIKAVFYDNCGNHTEVAEPATIDNRCPADEKWTGNTCTPIVFIDWPKNGNKIADLEYLHVGFHSSFNHVQFELDGEPVGPIYNTGYSAGLTWDSRTVPDGNHTLTAYAWNDSGSGLRSDPVIMIVHNSTDFCTSYRDIENTALNSCGRYIPAGTIDLFNDVQNEKCLGLFHSGSNQGNYQFDMERTEYAKPPVLGGTITFFPEHDYSYTCLFGR